MPPPKKNKGEIKIYSDKPKSLKLATSRGALILKQKEYYSRWIIGDAWKSKEY